MAKVTAARSKVESRSHHEVAHLHSLTNVSTRFQLPKSCSTSNSRSLWHTISKSHHDVTHLHHLPMPIPSFNFLHLKVSEIQPGQTFSGHPPSCLDAMGENTMMLHTYTHQPMSLPYINYLHLKVSNIQPRQDLSSHSSARLLTRLHSQMP